MGKIFRPCLVPSAPPPFYMKKLRSREEAGPTRCVWMGSESDSQSTALAPPDPSSVQSAGWGGARKAKAKAQNEDGCSPSATLVWVEKTAIRRLSIQAGARPALQGNS